MLAPSNSAPFPFPGSAQKGSRIPWYVAVIGCVYYAWLWLSLHVAIPIFAQLFMGLGIDLPLPTRILFLTYAWLFPVLFLGALILTLARHFAVLNDSQRPIANWCLLFIGAIFPALVVLALYWPLFVLTYKVHSAQ
jgi:hypothetical protein